MRTILDLGSLPTHNHLLQNQPYPLLMVTAMLSRQARGADCAHSEAAPLVERLHAQSADLLWRLWTDQSTDFPPPMVGSTSWLPPAAPELAELHALPKACSNRRITAGCRLQSENDTKTGGQITTQHKVHACYGNTLEEIVCAFGCTQLDVVTDLACAGHAIM